MSEPKVAVIVRTFNEERVIERFLKAYEGFPILVADGGSKDATLAICERYPNVTVRPFDGWVERGEVGRNPEGKHVNFLVDWATKDGYEWVIFDDCDCVPNQMLREDMRTILSLEQAEAIYVVRIYLYKREGCLIGMSKPRGHFEGSLWAWRTSSALRAIEDDPFMLGFPLFGRSWKVHELMPPHCLLHDPWPDDEAIERKRQFYQALWPEHQVKHPKDFGGPLVPLPEWAHE